MAYQIRPYREKDFDEVISLLVDSYRKYFKKVFDNDLELFDFLSDIQAVPRVQPEGFFVAEEEGKVTGAICLKWNTLKHTSSLELIHRSVKYRHLKLYRRIVGEIVFDHDIEDDECHIEQFVVRHGQGNEEIAWDLLHEGEAFAANHLYKHITMEVASGEPFIERVLKVNGFRTRNVRNSRLLKYFKGDGTYKFMEKTPGNKSHQLTIGMFTDTYMPQINGVATSISILTNELEKMGHRVYIITIRDKMTTVSFDGKVLRIPGVKVLRGTDYRLANIIVSSQVSKIVRELNLDVIHTHTEFAIGLLGTHFAKSEHLPHVHTYHTMYDDYIHYTTNFKPFQKLAMGIIKTYVKDFTDECNKVFVPTEKTKDVLVDYGVDTELVTIPTGIDFSKFIIDESHEKVINLKKELGFAEEDFVCLNIGRVSKEKNVEAIIDNVVELLPDYERLKLVIIGDGPDFNRLVEKTKDYRDSIVFLGRVAWEEIGYYYKLGDVFAVASRFETQGLTIIEALSSGIPVICPDDEAFVNVVEDGVNGMIFSQDDQIKDKILALMDEDTYDRVLANTKNSVVKYSAEYFAETIQNQYLSLMD